MKLAQESSLTAQDMEGMTQLTLATKHVSHLALMTTMIETMERRIMTQIH
jgi:hypothetical protein